MIRCRSIFKKTAVKPSHLTLIVLICITATWGLSGNARCANLLKIGFLEEPKTLNIWLASDTWSRKVLGQIYQPLYVRDPDTLKLVPWLAQEAPVYDSKTLSYTIHLRSARWSDGSEFTSEDVAFTGRLIQEFKVPRYIANWKFINKIDILDKHTVRFYLAAPKAIFLTRTLTTPVVQKKEWINVLDNARKSRAPITKLLNRRIKTPVGTGPFVLKEWRQGAYIFLEKNKYFFGKDQEINGRRLGPFIDGIVFKVFGTSDAAIMAIRRGSIDMFWWGIQPGYLDELRSEENIHIFCNEKSSLYYMGFNVRRPPFDDANLRRAIATLIEKDFIISRVLQGYAASMWSIVPPGNRFWYCPDVPRYGEGLNREERTRKAYDILRNAGYTWEIPPVDKNGRVVKGKGIRLPDGRPMERFTILTPPADYDPHRAMSGMLIQEWLRMAGMPAYSKPMAFGSLIQQVKLRHEFDTFILGYGNLSLDPDYLRNFFLSKNDKPRGWNISGYNNPRFDQIADKSAMEMNREKRKKLIWEMQKIIIRDIPYFPLYNPNLMEAVRTEKFSGWVPMLGGIGNIWSFCELKPM